MTPRDELIAELTALILEATEKTPVAPPLSPEEAIFGTGTRLALDSLDLEIPAGSFFGSTSGIATNLRRSSSPGAGLFFGGISRISTRRFTVSQVVRSFAAVRFSPPESFFALWQPTQNFSTNGLAMRNSPLVRSRT